MVKRRDDRIDSMGASERRGGFGERARQIACTTDPSKLNDVGAY